MQITRGPQSPPPFPVVARVQIGERLPVGVTDDVAAGYLVDAPWCGETAGCFSASRAEFHLGDEPPVAIMSPACLAGPSYGCRRKGVKSRRWKICCWTWYTGSGELSPFSHASLGSLTATLKETPSLKRLQVSCLSACGRPQSIFSTGGPLGPQKPPLRFPRPDHRRAVRVLTLSQSRTAPTDKAPRAVSTRSLRAHRARLPKDRFDYSALGAQRTGDGGLARDTCEYFGLWQAGGIRHEALERHPFPSKRSAISGRRVAGRNNKAL